MIEEMPTDRDVAHIAMLVNDASITLSQARHALEYLPPGLYGAASRQATEVIVDVMNRLDAAFSSLAQIGEGETVRNLHSPEASAID